MVTFIATGIISGPKIHQHGSISLCKGSGGVADEAIEFDAHHNRKHLGWM
jgi:hypothetical protein